MKLKDWAQTNKELFISRDFNFLMDIFAKKNTSLLSYDYDLDDNDIRYLCHLKNLYSKGWPIAYILRRENFFGLDFFVGPGALIPRPETEIITEQTLRIINENSTKSVLDLCCGTSCIAVVVAKETKNKLYVFASDISNGALLLSRKNIDFHRVRVRLIRSDLFSAFREKSFDLIVTNPPYVETNYIKGSLGFEPRIALDGGRDGFRFIRQILEQAYKYLKNSGRIIIEIGYNHKELLSKHIKAKDRYKIVRWIKDYSSYTRGVVLRVKRH